MRLDQLEPGMTLYDVRSERAGNTTMRVEWCWEVRVVSVHLDASPPYAMLAWNVINPARKYFTVPRGWKRWPKEWIRQSLFSGRSCALCFAKEGDGHHENCQHPRAVSARAKAAKAVTP